MESPRLDSIASVTNSPSHMESDGLLKKLAITFTISVVAYFAIFHWIEHRRVSSGPWNVTFVTDTNAQPSVIIAQEKLKLSNLRITFPEQRWSESNLLRSIQYDTSKTNCGFGEIVFQDPTFLPGTVTFNFFGHEVELLPRTLIIDKREYPWIPNDTIYVRGAGKFQPKKKKY